jgi:predicted dehydrogenase
MTPTHQPTKKYGLLLVAGRRTHQENYAPNFAADPRCRLIAVTDEPDVPLLRAELNHQLAADLNLPYLPDLDAALGRDDVQVVSVCTEPERRARVAVRSARAGKHVYLDKPMATSAADADAVVAAVAEAGVRSQMFSFIHTPWAQSVRRALESGAVGELTAIHADVFFAKGTPGTAPVGQRRVEKYPPEGFVRVDSKREMYELAVYPVGLMRYLAGREVETVYGRTANYFFAEHVRNGMEDFGCLALTLEGGLTATIAAGRIGWQSHPAGGVQRVWLCGTEGTLLFDVNRPRLEVCAAGPPWTPPFNPNDPMGFWRSTMEEAGMSPKRQWQPLLFPESGPTDESYFIDCIEAGRESDMSARDAAAVLKVLLAGYRSVAEGRVVSLREA